MAKNEISFDVFINSVDFEYQNFIRNLHEHLLTNNCNANIEQKSSGYFVAYAFGKSKKSAVNFLFRKKGMIVRIYGENAHNYIDFIKTLPDELIGLIEKAPNCKRLIDPNACNPKCTMGYDFAIENTNYKKCKNNCFMFDVNDSNNPYIESFIKNEIKHRLIG